MRTIHRCAVASLLVLSMGLLGCVARVAPQEPAARLSQPSLAAGEASPAVGRHAQVAELPVEHESISLEPWPVEEFWLQVAGGSFEYTSLASMTRSTDAVVVGRIRSIGLGRPLPDTTESGYGNILFALERLVAGSVNETQPGLINVEFFMADSRLFPRYTGRVPAERVVLFLSNKAEDARDLGMDPNGPLAGEKFYRVASDQGFLRDVGGKVKPPIGATDRWLTDLAGRDFDATVDDLATLARRSFPPFGALDGRHRGVR